MSENFNLNDVGFVSRDAASLAIEKYLQEVLGIRNLLFPLDDCLARAEKPQFADDCRLYFLLDEPWTSSDEAIFQKMIAALKLRSDEFVCLQTLQQLRDLAQPPRFLVSFRVLSEQDRPQLSPGGESSEHDWFWVCTPGPRSFAEDPSLKRQTWSDLQRAHHIYSLAVHAADRTKVGLLIR